MRLLKSETADATIIGQVVILAISIIGISTVILYGVPTIYSLQDLANVKNVEQSLTVLDSRASRAILGESPLQVNNINLGGGTLAVEPNSTSTKSYIVVKSSSFNFTIPMGKIRYTLGDRIVAYEGGGVWSKYPSGASVMLSPPEFHYNGVTLSLPAINISGSTSVSGKGTATISFKKNAPQVLYPNTSVPNRTNPVTVSTGKVYVNITSDFYDAWADYAKSLGYATVSTNSTTHTTSLELAVVPNNLGTDIPIANPVVFRGLNESDATPLENLSFWLDPFGNKFNWDIRASSGKKILIFYIKGDAKKTGDTVDLNVGYEDDGSGYTNPAETWTGQDILIVQGGGTVYLSVDLLNRSLNLNYAKKTVGADASCSPSKINDGKFNDTNGFSWNLTQTIQTVQIWQNKWWFNSSNESWMSTNTTTTANVTMSFTSSDGNASGSIYSNITGNNNTSSTTNWTSPNFTWNNGTPTSARLDFDWKVAKFDATNTSPGNFYVMLVKPPDGSMSLIYPNTTFNAIASWSAKSNASISVSDFAVGGNYSIMLIATLNTPKAMQTTQYNKWWFNSSTESWTPTYTTTPGIVTMIFNSTDGNSSGSIYSKLNGSANRNSTTTWTSLNFTWNNGIPASARLDFDWKVSAYLHAKPGNFYVKLVKPDGNTSLIYPNTTFSTTSPWSNKSNTSVSVNDFFQPGNYSLKLIAELNTNGDLCAGCWNEEVGWDNPTITLNYTATSINTTEVRWDNPAITLNYTSSSSGVSPLTTKSLYDITQHYFGIMAQDGDGTITFYQCSPSGKQAPASDSTMLMDYVTPGGLTYLQISENRVDAVVS